MKLRVNGDSEKKRKGQIPELGTRNGQGLTT